MDWMSKIGDVLERYSSPDAPKDNNDVENDFDTVTAEAPPQVFKTGLADAFRSDQTPPFPQMLSQIFGNSRGPQRAGILNMLIGMIGPQILGKILGGNGANRNGNSNGNGSGGGILSDLINGKKREVTADEADQIDPSTVQDIAVEAEKKDPSIVDRASEFYAENPTLVKGIGVAALAFLMSRMAKGGPFRL